MPRAVSIGGRRWHSWRGSWRQGALLAARRSAPTVMLTLPVAIAVHTAFLGAPGWLTPDKWPGHLVPITLLSFLVAVTTLVLMVIWWRKQKGMG